MKSILITGCSTGIGYVCAKKLKEDGLLVLATARKSEDVEKLKKEGFNAFRLDISDEKSIHEAILWVKSQTKKLDFLFNNAGFAQPGAVEDLNFELLHWQFRTNVFGSIVLTNEVLKLMREQNSGRVFFNSSVLGFIALKYRGAYNASKFALEGFCDTLRLELDDTKIKAILIEPGPIISNFRINALRNFISNIDIYKSFHKECYTSTLNRLKSEKESSFTLSQEAVYKSLKKAMFDKNPKLRYQVTTATILLWYFKKILPAKLMDKILIKASD